MSLYIGVYTAVFDYEPQTDEELKITAGDLLYLLERSDVDDWWKVKKRVVPVGDEEVEEPSGLVPSNYIEPAHTIKTATALYDYAKQTEEELSFKEGDSFSIFDLTDPDWLLVGSGENFGFIPSNYVQLDNQSLGQTQPLGSQIPVTNFAPPPQHISRQVIEDKPEPVAKDEHRLQSQPKDEPQDLEPEDEPPLPSRRRPSQAQSNDYDDDDYEAPPMPSRPDITPTKGSNKGSYRKDEPEVDLNNDNPQHTFDGEFFKWFIDEIDHHLKKSVVLAIGNGLIILKPHSRTSPRKLSLRSSSATSSLDNEWKIRDLTSFNNEKKHLFLEFKNPEASVELHCGSKDVAEAIMSILADLKGADSARGLKEVERASQSKTGGNNRKIGRIIYDFESQGSDELGCREGDEVYILNESKSKDWWMCEKIINGKQGVVPSSYIEIISTSNLDKLTEQPDRQKSLKDKKKQSKSNRHRGRDEREKIREKDRMEREKSSSKRDSESNDKSMPNFHRVRTWIDSSGSFKVEAEFLGCIEGKIHLHKTNGVKIAVAATKLCVEDLEYVEKVTGTSLESYKEEVNKQNAKRKAHEKKQGKSDELPPRPKSDSGSKSAMAIINDVAPPKPARSKASATLAVSDPEYDWFEFFLNCGIDIGNCQRYTLNFNREQMDDKILEDITPSLLRTLGLREGDIIRVMKFLDTKFDRKKPEESQPSGPLFTEPTGALRNNSTSEIPKVDASALPSQPSQPPVVQPPAQTNKFEDDAWAIKPAARSNEDLSKPQQPQYTGSLSDLVNIKPIESNNKPIPALPQEKSTAPSAPALTPVRTGTLIQPGQEFKVQQPGNTQLVSPQKTGTLIPVQRTGGLVPIQMTGGFIAAQPTGFMPITAQPTGFVAIQQTGGLAPQFTMGGTLIPIRTGPPMTSFNQPVLQTGSVTMPATSFGQQPMFTGGQPMFTGGAPPPTSFGQPLSLQRTGPLIPVQVTGGNPQFGQQSAPQFGQQLTGGNPQFGGQQNAAMPQTSFGQQITGGFQPQSSFGQQITGGFQPQSSFGQQVTGGAPPTSFGQPQNSFGQPQTSFGQQNTFGQSQNQPPTSFGQQNFGQQNFGQQMTGGAMPPTSFGQPNFGQPQNGFGQQFQTPQTSFGNGMNQVTNMFQNTSINPPTSFGQSGFEGFNQLQSQPTGSGFGNAPLANQPTGKRANLQAATPDNPFGF